jgi:hypothetical protein
MEQAFRDALQDDELPQRLLVRIVVRDLMISLVKEHLAMLRDSLTRPALVFSALVLAGIATGVALALYAIPQHVLRSGLDSPQIQMAEDLCVRLEQGVAPAEAMGTGSQVDMARSLAPFVIVYDEQGHAVSSQGVLNGAVPTPPIGVFENVRRGGEERLTWQPVRGPDCDSDSSGEWRASGLCAGGTEYARGGGANRGRADDGRADVAGDVGADRGGHVGVRDLFEAATGGARPDGGGEGVSGVELESKGESLRAKVCSMAVTSNAPSVRN